MTREEAKMLIRLLRKEIEELKEEHKIMEADLLVL